MNKNEMKKIAKEFAKEFENVTIITKSIFINTENNTMVCNGFDESGICKEMFFDFENLLFSIQMLSGICLHEQHWYNKQFQKFYENYFIK